MVSTIRNAHSNAAAITGSHSIRFEESVLRVIGEAQDEIAGEAAEGEERDHCAHSVESGSVTRSMISSNPSPAYASGATNRAA